MRTFEHFVIVESGSHVANRRSEKAAGGGVLDEETKQQQQVVKFPTFCSLLSELTAHVNRVQRTTSWLIGVYNQFKSRSTVFDEDGRALVSEREGDDDAVHLLADDPNAPRMPEGIRYAQILPILKHLDTVIAAEDDAKRSALNCKGEFQ